MFKIIKIINSKTKKQLIKRLNKMNEITKTISPALIIMHPSWKSEEAINHIIKETSNLGTADTNLISDGYHTFGELYEHRIVNFIALCRVLKYYDAEVWRSLKHSDGELAFGGTWFVLGIEKGIGEQITYHLPIDKWDECEFAEILEKAPTFDGHTSEEVLERLKQL